MHNLSVHDAETTRAEIFIVMAYSYCGISKRTWKKILKYAWKWWKAKKASKPDVVITERLCSTVDEFLAMREKIGRKPEGGAVCFIHALINYANPDPEVHKLGVAMMIMCMSEENVVATESTDPNQAYNGYMLHRSDFERLARVTDYLARSYITGADANNQYHIADPANARIGFRSQTEYAGSVESGVKKVFVWSGGADTSRPIQLKRNVKGFWKVNEFSSVTVGIRAPASTDTSAADAL